MRVVSSAMICVFGVLTIGCGSSGGGATGGDDDAASEAPDAAVVADTPDAGMTDVEIADVPGTDGSGEAGTVWVTNFEPGVEVRGNVKILRLKGSPYEMGVQHATFFEEELKAGVAFIESSMLGMLEPFASYWGFLEEGLLQSYPDVLEECRGMSDTLGDAGWTMERCLALAYGDVVIEYLNNGDLACSQFAAIGPAANGGEMLHGRNLDWDKLDFLLQNPVVIVRHPTGKIPHMVVGFPGMVAPYSGVNAAGVSIASNEANSRNDIDRTGRSHVQMVSQILANATSLDDAHDFLKSQDHMSAEILFVADGEHQKAAAFEMSATHFAMRATDDKGMVWATNHFVDPVMTPYVAPLDPKASTLSRFARLKELLDPATGTKYGKLDLPMAASVLRDGHNPLTGEDIPAEQFDNGGTLANNGCIYSMVFAPRLRTVWLATGALPIPQNPYVGFSLYELAGMDGATAIVPASVP